MSIIFLAAALISMDGKCGKKAVVISPINKV